MELNHFNDFFSLMAPANLGYAGFRRFRDVLNNEVLKLANKKNAKIAELEKSIQEKTTVFSLEMSNKDDLKDLDKLFFSGYEIVKQSHDEGKKTITQKSQIGFKISEGFKSMFLYSGCFCLALLIAAGYQSHAGDLNIQRFLYLINLTAFYNVFIFIRSFTTLRTKKVAPIVPLTVVMLSLCSFPIILAYDPPIESGVLTINIAVSILISLSAYLFYFIRLNVHLIYYRNQFKKNDKECSRKLESLNTTMEMFMIPGIFTSRK